MQRLTQWLATVIRIRFLRNLLLLALVLPLVIPIYYQLWELPQYRRLMLDGARQDAVLVARHVAGMLNTQAMPLSAEALPAAFGLHADEMMADFSLDQLRLYGADGTVIHSTHEGEVGQVNQQAYFRQQVMAGEIYTRLIHLPGRHDGGGRDVVVTYVPVMRDDRFLGAIAIDYDISSRKAAFDTLFSHSILITLLLCGALLLAAVSALLRAGRDVAERESMQQVLADREALLHSITASAKDAIVMINAAGEVVHWNMAASGLFGYSAEEVMGHALHPLIAPERYRADYLHGMAAFRQSGQGAVIGKTLELTGRRKEGDEFPLELSVAAVQRNSSWHAIGIMRDITARKRTERHLQMGSRVMTHVREGIMVVDAEGDIEMVNPAFTEITGYTAAEVVGRNPSLLQSGRHDRAFYEAMWQGIREKDAWQGEVWNRRRDGEIYPELLSLSVVREADGKVVNYIGIFSDITRRKESEQRLERLAFHDPLTGLANRLLFMDRLRQATRQARRSQEHMALLFLDLDRFKQVNDRHGHHIGDLLLKEAAVRILASLREQDTVARLGGDEFIILLQGISQSNEVDHLADKVRSTLMQPFQLQGHTCKVGCSIGVSFYPTDADSAEELIERADEAMYRAKQGGTTGICFYRATK